MPVHLYGHPARMDAVRRLADGYGLRIVEDAAPSIGAEWQGRRTGSFGDFGCFSFQGAKLLVTGEGGMLVTDDDDLYERARKLWDQGRRPGTFWIDETGWKYRMANVQAALGLGQLQRVDALVEAKRRIFQWYAEDLGGIEGIQLNHEVIGARSIYWMTSLLIENGDREALRQALRARGIDTRPVFPAISRYPIWDREAPPQPVARRIGESALNLPSGVRLTRDEVLHVTSSIREVLGG
jgi:perosamine synthetase